MTPEPTQHSTADPALDWAGWLERHGGKLFYFAVHWNAEDPEDALQHAVVQTARAVAEGRCEADETAALRYAYTALRTRLYRAHERCEHRRAGETAWGREQVLLTSTDSTEEECRRVEAALAQLPPQEAEIVVLHLWENMSFIEIGGLLDLNRNTVSARYRRALESIRRHLKNIPE